MEPLALGHGEVIASVHLDELHLGPLRQVRRFIEQQPALPHMSS